MHTLSIEQARYSFSRLLYRYAPPVPEKSVVTEIVMPRANAPALLARLYRPAHSHPDTNLPVLLWFHGGGWCLGDLDSYDPLCHLLAYHTGCAVLAVEYRLAPEAPFPAAIEDARFAFDWTADQASVLNIDSTRIALAGDSAGATLSIVTALSLKKTADCPPALLLLIYPCTDTGSTRPSRQAYANGYFLDADTLHWFFTQYAGKNPTQDWHTRDWRISPLHAPSLGDLPPILMVTAEYDPLLDDCIAFRDRVQSAGGDIEYHCAAGMIHGFLNFGGLFPEAETTLARIARIIRTRLMPSADTAD